MNSKFQIFVAGVSRGFIWAFDEFDARWRYAKRCEVDFIMVKAVEIFRGYR